MPDQIIVPQETAGPWQKYQAQSKPWEKYAKTKNFVVTAPDGKKYRVTGPDGSTKDAALEAVQRRLGDNGKGNPTPNFWENAPVVSSPQTGPGEDMAKSFGSGLVKGAIGLAEMPATLGEWLADKTVRGVEHLMGTPQEEIDRKALAAQRFKTDNPSLLPDPTTLSENFAPSYRPQTTAGKYADTLGQFLPSTLAGGPAGMGAKLVGSGTGAIASESAGQLTEGSEAEPYARVLAGLVGGLTPALARRAVTPLPISSERQRLVEALRNEGVDLTAGQSSGRKGLQYMESELGGGRIAGVMERQGEQFTGAALRRAGINAERATPEVIDQGFTRLGNEFDGLAARNNVPPDARLATEVAATVTDYANLVPAAARAPVIQNLANDMVTAATQGLPGPRYQAYRSRLEAMARKSTDPHLREVLRGMREALDDAMERHLASTGSADLGAWREVRNQYRNMIVLEQAATGAGSDAAQGLISPSHLRNATVTKHGRRNYARGQGDFAELARAGEATMKPLPQSGTAPRTAARALGTSIPSLLGAFAGSGGGLPGFIAGAAGGAALPFVAGRALLSEPMRRYLSNQKMTSQPLPTRQRLAQALAASSPQINYTGGH